MAHISSRSPNAFDSLLDDLGIGEQSDDGDGMFERVRTIDKSSQLDPDEEALVRDENDFAHFLRRTKATMGIVKAAGGLYDVEISFSSARHDDLPIGPTHVQLLSRAYEVEFDKRVRFREIELKDLSEFVRLFYRSGELRLTGVLKCDSKNDATRAFLDKRRAELFRSVCANDGDQLIDYLNFRLSKNPELEASVRGRYGKADSASALSLPLEGLYETLVRAYSDDREEADEVVSECLDLLAQQEDDGETARDEGIDDLKRLLEAFSEGEKDAR